MLSWSRSLISRLLLLAAISLPTLCLAKEPDVTLLLDPKVSVDWKVTTVWYGYLLARTKYREEHKLQAPESGTILPTFDEEIYARMFGAQIYQELKDEHKDWREPYWETLSQIKTKGFMKAYIWTFLRHPNWPENQQPKNLSAFKDWSRSILENHVPQTHGALVVERK